MSLPYDPTREVGDMPLDTSHSSSSLGEYQPAATNTAAASVESARICSNDIQEGHTATDTEAADDNDASATGSPHEPSAPSSPATNSVQGSILTSQEALIVQQKKLIQKWASRSSKELATILEDNMQSHIMKEHAVTAKDHREEMAETLRDELTPIVYSRLYKDMRPTVISRLRAEQRPLVRQELREEALRAFTEPLKQRVMDDVIPYKNQQLAQVDEEVQSYRQQGFEDAEVTCNNYYSSECQSMEEELQSVYKEGYREVEDEIEAIRKKKTSRMEDEVHDRVQRFWERERVRGRLSIPSRSPAHPPPPIDRNSRVLRRLDSICSEDIFFTQEMEEYEESRANEIEEKFKTAREKLAEYEKSVYADVKKKAVEEKKRLNYIINAKCNDFRAERMAAIDAEIALEKARRSSLVEESAGGERPVQGATGPESDSGNGKALSPDTVKASEKTLAVDQAKSDPENTLAVDQAKSDPENIRISEEDIQKERSVTPNQPRSPRRSAVRVKRARDSEEETTESKSDSVTESQSVSINQKHDGSDGSTRPTKRIRQHSSSPSSVSRPSQQPEDAQQSSLINEAVVRPSFVVDSKPLGGPSSNNVPTYHRSTDAVLGAKAVVPKSLTSIQDWSCNPEAPEQEDVSAPRGIRFFENASSAGTPAASSAGTLAASAAETAPASSTGTAATSSIKTTATNSTDITMSTSKNYQFGQYQTLVNPAVMARAMANHFQSSKSGTTQEKVVTPPAAAAAVGEDEDDEL
ncbi:MAG: hypothetical protein Q9195_000527 [Heterodermia aff. obscurata]